MQTASHIYRTEALYARYNGPLPRSLRYALEFGSEVVELAAIYRAQSVTLGRLAEQSRFIVAAKRRTLCLSDEPSRRRLDELAVELSRLRANAVAWTDLLQGLNAPPVFQELDKPSES